MTASLTIRPATSDDIADLARIHLCSKQKAYSGSVDEAYLQSLTQQDFEAMWSNYLNADDASQCIACIDDMPVGFISFGRLRTPPPGTSRIRPLYAAEIFAIYLHPDYWQQGIGQKLMLHAVSLLGDQKLKSLCLWVIDGNKNAQKFYDALGGQRIGKRNIEVGPSKVKELCYGWRDTNLILSKS